MGDSALVVLFSSSATVLVAAISAASAIWGTRRQERSAAAKEQRAFERQQKADAAERVEARRVLQNERAEEFSSALLESMTGEGPFTEADADAARIRFLGTLLPGQGAIAEEIRSAMSGLSHGHISDRRDKVVTMMDRVFTALRGEDLGSR